MATWTFDGTGRAATEIMRDNPSAPLSYAGVAVNEDSARMWLGDQIIRPGDSLERDSSGNLTIHQGEEA